MVKHFQKELEKVKKTILSLGALVEDRVHVAVEVIDSLDTVKAQNLIKSDYEIDEVEVEIEEDCLKILALHQPVAVDLRFLIAVIKINNDLERIGDEAVNIAQRVETIAKKTNRTFHFDYSTMGQKAQDMLRMSLDALVNMDSDIAFKVLIMDDEVDEIKREAYKRVKKAMQTRADEVSYLINLLLISRHIERLADHATNIAEEVIYMIEGEIVRHGKY